MAYIAIVVFSPKFWSINLISLLYISQGEPEFQTFVAIWRQQGNDNEGRANQADLQFSILRSREREFRETCQIDHAMPGGGWWGRCWNDSRGCSVCLCCLLCHRYNIFPTTLCHRSVIFRQFFYPRQERHMSSEERRKKNWGGESTLSTRRNGQEPLGVAEKPFPAVVRLDTT